VFLIDHNLWWGWLPWDSITLVSSIFLSIPQRLTTSVCLSNFLCNTVYSLLCSTKSSAYFTLRITFPPNLKFSNPSRVSLVRYSMCKLNRIGDKQHPYLTDFPISTLLLSPGPVVFQHTDPCTICWSQTEIFLVNYGLLGCDAIYSCKWTSSSCRHLDGWSLYSTDVIRWSMQVKNKVADQITCKFTASASCLLWQWT